MQNNGGAKPDGRERRGAERHLVNIPNEINLHDKRVPCRLVDVSDTGALIETRESAVVGSNVAISLPGLGDMVGTVVRVTATHVALSFPGILAIAPVLAHAAQLA